jgi:acetylornithine deacetylase/succinyl-diaminopimelate desuccinylase-like protein
VQVTTSKIFRNVASNKKWQMKILFDYLKIPSISAQGKGVRESVKFLKRLFETLGFDTKVIETKGYPVVFAQRKSRDGKKSILFYNHYDVQPPDPLDEWKSPPFEPTVRGGKIFARGVADNKANLIARIAAVKAILETDGDLPINVSFFVEGEEEIGSPNLKDVVEKNRKQIMADLCIWESGGINEKERPIIILGCKGIITGELVSTTASVDIHSAMATVITNPAWRLVWALSCIKDRDERILIDGFYDNIVKPNRAEMKLLARLKLDEKGIKKRYGIKKFINNVSGKELVKRLLCGTSFNIAGIRSGYIQEGHKTVLPHTAFVKFDIRLVPDMKVKDIIEKLRRHLNRSGFRDIEIKNIHGYPPAKTSAEHPLVKKIIKTAKRIWKKNPVIYPTMGGSGPMYLFANIMPCIGVGVGNARSNIHAPNEQIRTKDFFTGTNHIVDIISRLEA